MDGAENAVLSRGTGTRYVSSRGTGHPGTWASRGAVCSRPAGTATVEERP
jgi:hypothetical protein